MSNQMVVDEKALTVKVHNDVFKAVQPLNASELDLFFAIMAKMKDKGNAVVEIPIDKMIEITHYKGKKSNFYQECRDLPARLASLPLKVKIGPEVRYGHIFTKIIINIETGTLTAPINDDFIYLLNELEKSGHFTLYELEEYVRLQGVHARKFYQLLKQWRKFGGRHSLGGKKKLFEMKEVRDAFNLKDTYLTSHIEHKIIKPCLPQINKYFHNFNYKIVKGGRGNTIIGYYFTFDPEPEKEYISAPKQSTKSTESTMTPKPKKKEKPIEEMTTEETRQLLQDLLGDM